MKASSVRKVAKQRSSAEIAQAVAALVEREEEIFEIPGADPGERLTHLLLAQRIVTRVDGGEDFREAFRAVMAQVRLTLENEE